MKRHFFHLTQSSANVFSLAASGNQALICCHKHAYQLSFGDSFRFRAHAESSMASDNFNASCHSFTHQSHVIWAIAATNKLANRNRENDMASGACY